MGSWADEMDEYDPYGRFLPTLNQQAAAPPPSLTLPCQTERHHLSRQAPSPGHPNGATSVLSVPQASAGSKPAAKIAVSNVLQQARRTARSDPPRPGVISAPSLHVATEANPGFPPQSAAASRALLSHPVVSQHVPPLTDDEEYFPTWPALSLPDQVTTTIDTPRAAAPQVQGSFSVPSAKEQAAEGTPGSIEMAPDTSSGAVSPSSPGPLPAALVTGTVTVDHAAATSTRGVLTASTPTFRETIVGRCTALAHSTAKPPTGKDPMYHSPPAATPPEVCDASSNELTAVACIPSSSGNQPPTPIVSPALRLVAKQPQAEGCTDTSELNSNKEPTSATPSIALGRIAAQPHQARVTQTVNEHQYVLYDDQLAESHQIAKMPHDAANRALATLAATDPVHSLQPEAAPLPIGSIPSHPSRQKSSAPGTSVSPAPKRRHRAQAPSDLPNDGISGGVPALPCAALHTQEDEMNPLLDGTFHSDHNRTRYVPRLTKEAVPLEYRDSFSTLLNRITYSLDVNPMVPTWLEAVTASPTRVALISYLDPANTCVLTLTVRETAAPLVCVVCCENDVDSRLSNSLAVIPCDIRVVFTRNSVRELPPWAKALGVCHLLNSEPPTRWESLLNYAQDKPDILIEEWERLSFSTELESRAAPNAAHLFHHTGRVSIGVALPRNAPTSFYCATRRDHKPP